MSLAKVVVLNKSGISSIFPVAETKDALATALRIRSKGGKCLVLIEGGRK